MCEYCYCNVWILLYFHKKKKKTNMINFCCKFLDNYKKMIVIHGFVYISVDLKICRH